MKKILLFVSIALGGYLWSYGQIPENTLVSPRQIQTWKVTGTVIDAMTKDPIIGASVVEVGVQNGTSTNDDGKYVLTMHTYNHPAIYVSCMGYDPQTVEIDPPKGGGTITINVSLKQSEQQLE